MLHCGESQELCRVAAKYFIPGLFLADRGTGLRGRRLTRRRSFTVAIAQRNPPDRGAMPADNAEPRGAPQILVVEDEPLIRLLATDMLERLGYRVLEAGTGAEALTLACDPQYALHALMIDLGLPDLAGEEVLRRIRALRPGLPVIVTTGADTHAAARRLSDCEPLLFLEKPYYIKDLEIIVAALPTAG
jgi:CheY-like chemotaxis protein